jgi:regulator of nucleoside diphosphate kinase
VTGIETNNSLTHGLVPPSIRIAEDEMHRLGDLAESCRELFPRIAQFLSQEMARATVAADARDLQGVVRMGSKVTYRDDTTGATHEVALVYPHEVNTALNCVSILTHVGAALIGLSAGQRIKFRTPGSGIRCITVLAVSNQ